VTPVPLLMKIEIWSDIACPWCYIGKRRFEQALALFPHRDALDIIWRSFELDTTKPARATSSNVERLAVKYGMSIEKAQAMTDNMAAAGASEGLEFDFERVNSGNTFDAHRLIHFAATVGLRAAMVERLFKAYFTDGEAIGDHDTLVRLATDTGMDPVAVRDMLTSTAYASDVRGDEARAQEFGITGVPFFAIDERYGISGAQPSTAILDALMQAWNESSAKTAGGLT
jgi:predicted DsbA family dithiol-disulfide isomerase